jgi:hypothetical protein
MIRLNFRVVRFRAAVLVVAPAIAVGLGCLLFAGCGGGSGTGTIATVPGIQTAYAEYGNDTTEVALYNNHTTFTNGCGTVDFPKPIAPYQNGGFTLTGLYPSNVPITAVYAGSIQGNTMQITATNQQTGAVINTFTLTLGVTNQFTTGTCP